MSVNRSASTASTDSASKLPVDSNNVGTKENFLQLLIAQIKNQNPLNPEDGTQFLSQLNQFTATEQMVGMRQDLAAIRTALEGVNATSSGTTA
jgi:flagellar basal-body rod modification protein FlgD